MGVARWIQSRRGPVPVGSRRHADESRRGDDSASEDAAAWLSALRAAAAGIGTKPDEDAARAELARAVVQLIGGTAAVMRRSGHTVSEYEQITGDAQLLPDARWAAAVARETASPTLEEGAGPWVEYVGTTTVTALCVPLASVDDQYGVLVWARKGEPYSPPEAEVLALLAERAASHIQHVRAYEQISGTAGDLQRALLAEPGRPHPNMDVAVRYLPAGQRALVGGDWCETVRLHFGRTLLVVGDVMGHGLEAAVDMSAYRSSLRYIASSELPPHRVLRQMDDIAAGEADRRPATCLLARVDPGRGQLTLASAGHLPPVLITQDGEASLLPVPVGPPLGTGLGGYESATHTLEHEQTLVLFTDGLVEHRGEDIDASLARLAALRFAPGRHVDDLLDTILTRLDARHAEDDVAVLAARPHARQPAPGADDDAAGVTPAT
ncbi:PP2C family protein-serine/threonine phosphatase [Streptomyces sp. NPDC047085]|uniref:PP2C family protein-serine/threonine phosphatase n=1 Tax=Streptomyces sp. NPDC047085 TaxID=3155140 RepID=UPI0033F146C0